MAGVVKTLGIDAPDRSPSFVRKILELNTKATGDEAGAARGWAIPRHLPAGGPAPLPFTDFFPLPQFLMTAIGRVRAFAVSRRKDRRFSDSWRSTISHRGCSSRQFEHLFSAASELVCRCAKIVTNLGRGEVRVCHPSEGRHVWAV